MAKKMKDYYDHSYLEFIANKISDVHDGFSKEAFLREAGTGLDDLEFSGRQEHIAILLHHHMNLPYSMVIEVFYKILGTEIEGTMDTFNKGWWLWPIGRYVELFGLEDYDVSIAFSKELTKRFTSEYCMRPLIREKPVDSLKTIEAWSRDDNNRVRRLASECLRIRLPWSKKMDVALVYFDEYFEILSNLKDDPDKAIQKSVANNLNDLYKEDVDKFIFIIDNWSQVDMSPQTEWIIKHGSRSLNKTKG